MKIFKHFFSKLVARQLRKPGGLLAKRVGNEMNKTNKFLYDFTISEMHLQDNESILEIGFGNGAFFDTIFSSADNLTVAGLDFSKDMVKSAEARNTDAIQKGKLTLRMGSSEQIPFEENRFDKIFCINVTYFWEHPDLHLKEIYRVLKPGGKLYCSTRTKESLMQMPFAKHGFKMYSQDEWVAILQRNRLRFIKAAKTYNEPDAIIDNKKYPVESLCIIAEKTSMDTP